MLLLADAPPTAAARGEPTADYRPESMAAAKTKLITTTPGAKGSAKGSAPGSGRDPGRPVASNRRARHDYEITDTVECGLVLQGSEVKSLRAGRIALQDAYARIIDGEMWLFGVHIPPYAQANGFGAHDPDRRRKLLLHRRQIDEWMGKSQQQSLTMVPLSIYFRDGRAKVEVALARGRRQYDKRHAIASRDASREAAREARAATKRPDYR
ncbi:MAG TPA: SsrA-binding protein SmpB [Acidimicrobiales bacterium]|nr:SsrA-binding protein SmpB [Acidimicrobiales bacterium]